MRRWTYWLIALAAIGLALTTRASAHTADYRPGELFIKFKPGTSAQVQAQVLARIGGRLIKRFDHLGVQWVAIPIGKENATAAALQDEPAVEFSEPNYYLYAAYTPNDPAFATAQWNLSRVDAPSAWDVIRDAQEALIAVVDSGVDYHHPDLRESLWLNPAESVYNATLGREICDQDGIDDDGNGYVDDCYGWDWVDYDAAPLDQEGHGTQVTGTAAAATDNGIGMAGLGWGARFMSLRVLDETGRGDLGSLVEALHYLDAFASRRIIVNLSLSLPPGVTSDLLHLAIKQAHDHGMLIVAASGNNGQGQVNYPAAYPEVLAVGATTDQDQRWSLSNYGSALDVVAPGAGIYATTLNFTYVEDSGTSFATPHVSGLAALLWSAVPHLTADQIAEIIRTTADDVNVESQPGPDVYLGWGRINARRAAIVATSSLTISLTANPAGVPILGSAVITGTILQPDGKPAGTGLVVQFHASGGSVAPATAIAHRGVVTTTFAASSLEGTGIVTATLGAVSRAITIPISAGRPYTLTLDAVPPLLAVGGGQQGRAVLRAQVQDPAGYPVKDGTLVAFAADLGTIDPLTSTTASGVATTTLTSGSLTGLVHITATVNGLTATTMAEIVGPGQPFSLTLTTGSPEVTVGGGQAVITATVRDLNDDPVTAGHPVDLQVTGGTVHPERAQTNADGQVVATFTAGDALGTALITARSGPVLSARLALPIVPGDPAQITLTPASSEVETGDHYVPITATVTDRLGNPVRDGTFITFSTTLGQVTATRTATHNGRALSELRAGPTPGKARITATADNDAQGIAEIQIVPGPATRVTLSATSDTVEVNGQTALLARAWDAFDNPVRDGTSIQLVTDAGLLGPLGGSPDAPSLNAQAENGSVQASFFAPPTPGLAHITARAGPTATHTISITVQPGGPAQLTVTADATLISPGESVTVTARIRDSLGNPVADGTSVYFATTLGEISPRHTTTVNGVAEATFQAGPQTGDATIGVSVGDLFEVIVIRVREHIYYLPIALRR